MNQNSRKLPIGIDLGTTNSAVAAWWNGKAELVENNEGELVTPSYINVDYWRKPPIGHAPIIGRMVRCKGDISPMCVLFDSKRLLATNIDDEIVQKFKNSWTFSISNDSKDPFKKTYYAIGRLASPEEVSGYILKSLLDDVCRRFEKTPEEIEAVITVPANYGIWQKRATIAAAEEAGLTVAQLLLEPIAGAMYYQHEMNFKNGEIIFTFDLGGGTFDVTIMEFRKGLFKVIAIGGDRHLGGRDFDMIVVKEMENRLKKQLGKKIVENLDAKKKFEMLDFARKTKEALSVAKKHCLNLSDIHHDAIEKYFTQEEFEEKSKDLTEKIRKCCLKTIEDAKLSCDQINHRLIFGEASKMRFINKILEEIFGKDQKIFKTVSADESIAKGAAMHAAKLLNISNDPKIQDLGFQETSSLPFGVKNSSSTMSVIIGIEFRQDAYEIAIYNNQNEDVEIRTGNFEEIISNLKDEFGTKLAKIFVISHKEFMTGIDINDESLCILSKKNLDFTHYLSVKPARETKILEFNCKWNTAVKCVLYDFTTVDNNIFQTVPIKCLKTHFNVEDFDEMLTYVFEFEPNEIHVIFYKSDAENNIFVAKIMEKKLHFCFFTKMDLNEMNNAYKAMVYGRFLLNDKTVQTLVKMEPFVEQYFKKLRSEHSNSEIIYPEPYTAPRPINTYQSKTRLMGIDLGTSRCVVCVSRNGRAELVKIDKEYAMPTIISFDEKQPIIGSVALRKLKQQPRSVLFDFKPILNEGGWIENFEDSWQFGICVTSEGTSFIVHSQRKLEEYSSIEIYIFLLEKLKAAASEFQADLNGEKLVDQAVITVPRSLDGEIIRTIRRAANLAGIKIIDIIDETRADVFHLFSEHNVLLNESVGIIDIGGGTGFTQKFMVRSGIVDKHFLEFFNVHGRVIDKFLMQKLRELLLEEHEININDIKEYQLLEKIENIKIVFSFDETTCLELPSKVTQNYIKLSRKWFEEEVLEPLLLRARVKEIVTFAMAKSIFFPIASKVFLIGGSCRIPYIQNYFKSILGEDRVIVPNNLQDITATGALIHGLQLLNDKTSSALVKRILFFSQKS